MPRLPQDIDPNDRDISYEFVNEFDEMLEIDEIEEDSMEVETAGLAGRIGPRVID